MIAGINRNVHGNLRANSPAIRACLKRSLALAVSGFLAVAAPRAQGLTQDELKVGSRPYAPQTENALRVQTNLVEVRVVVRDAKGQPVAGLRPEDFNVFDNGKLQTISLFAVETSPPHASAAAPQASPAADPPAPAPAGATRSPRFVALFFDDLNMGTADAVYTRKAAEQFIAGGLEPGDRVGVFTSSATVLLEFTDDTRKLLDSLAQLRSHLRRADGGSVSCPRMIPYQAHLIFNLRDPQAIDLAVAQGVQDFCLQGLRRSDQVMIVQRRAAEIVSVAENFSQDTMGSINRVIQHLGKMPGRRMLLLSSAGFFGITLQRQQDKLVDAALHAGVVINSLDAKGLVAEAPGGDLLEGQPSRLTRGDLIAYADMLRSEQRMVLNDPLASLSKGTGGRFFHDNNDLGAGFQELVATPGVSYLLGFSPENLKPDGRYHELKVKVAAPGRFAVDARRGYFAPDKQELAKPIPARRFDSEVLASDTVTDLPVEVTAQPEKLDSGETVLRVVIHMDARGLPFQRRDDRSTETLHFVAAVFDTRGKFLAGVEGVMDLALKDASLTRISAEGLDSRMSLQAPPGPYTLRVVVQELVQGRMAALSRPVEIQ